MSVTHLTELLIYKDVGDNFHVSRHTSTHVCITRISQLYYTSDAAMPRGGLLWSFQVLEQNSFQAFSENKIFHQ